MTSWKRGCRRKEKAVYFSTFNYTFFSLLFEHMSPHFFFFFLMRPCKFCSHLWWITKRDWVGQRLGWERSELGHRPAGCRHLSKCPLWHQNSILKPLQWWPISFRVKAKILTMTLSHCHFPCPPPWPHFPPLTSPLSCCQLPHCILPHQWHPTPVLSPGKSPGPGSPVGCSPWGS